MKSTNHMNESIAYLIESDLEQAELILAVKAMGDEVQQMAEKVAKMKVNSLMPIVERMKELMGQQAGVEFDGAMTNIVAELEEQIKQTKTEIDDQVAILSGEAPARPFEDKPVRRTREDRIEPEETEGPPSFEGEPAGAREMKESVRKLRVLERRYRAAKRALSEQSSPAARRQLASLTEAVKAARSRVL